MIVINIKEAQFGILILTREGIKIFDLPARGGGFDVREINIINIKKVRCGIDQTSY